MDSKQKALMALQNSIGDTKKTNEIWNGLSDELQRDMDVREVYFTALAYTPESDKDLMGDIISTTEESLEESNAFWNSLHGIKK